MSDTLVIAGYAADGLPTQTIGTTGTVFLEKNFSFGDLILSGSLLDRYAPRQITLPLVVKSTTRAVMRSYVESLVLALSREFFTLTWTPQGGLPVVFDCYDAQVGQQWDMTLDNQAVRRVNVTLLAQPHGRSADQQAVTGTTASGNRYFTQTVAPVVGSAPGLITDLELSGADLRSSLIHATPRGRPANIPMPCTSSGGGFDFSAAPNLNDYQGTFTVWLGLSAVPAGTHTNTASIYLEERISTGDLVGSGGVIGTFPIDDFGTARQGMMVAVGQVTLPLGASMGGARFYTALITILDETESTTNRVTPQEILFLSTDGTTIYQDSPSVTPTQVIVDAPGPTVDLNSVYASFGTTLGTYRAKTRSPRLTVISGPPMQAHPQTNTLMVYTPRATGPAFTARYIPRWLSERTL